MPSVHSRRQTRLLVLVAIVLLALLLRSWAALRLPLDYDEPVYLRAAEAYARALAEGDLAGIVDYAENREHPALGKLLYAFALLGVGQDADWMVAVYASRFVSVIFGVLTALLLALFDPLAGGLLAIHTLAVKYTAQVYLEALPHLASLAAVLALVRSTGRRDRWFWLSALALGVTAAGKFTYLPIVLVILYVAVWEKRIRWPDLLLYGAVAVATFWLLNPTLWREPFSRLFDSLFFHLRYSTGSEVELVAYSWHRPLYWISRAEPIVWHPEVFFYPGLDGLIFVLALPGLYWEWHQRRWVVVWIVTSVILLLLWPTKWPQYTLILTPALCLSASSTVRNLYHLVRRYD
ncbi:MAG: transcriptional regulator, partial [Anaerolineae bacterium]